MTGRAQLQTPRIRTHPPSRTWIPVSIHIPPTNQVMPPAHPPSQLRVLRRHIPQRRRILSGNRLVRNASSGGEEAIRVWTYAGFLPASELYWIRATG